METGKVKAGETTEVTYVYKEITGNVVVHYVDTEGNTLAEDTKDVENGSLRRNMIQLITNQLNLKRWYCLLLNS